MHHRHFGCSGRSEAMFLMGGRMRGPRGGFGSFGHGMGGRGGGGRGFMRAGRMLADGDLRLIALYLIAETPRHGYDIIKALEERSVGFYSPSPGVVYPTLTFLEEAGYAVSETQGTKKVFSITETGQTYLDENRDTVEAVLDEIGRFGRKMARARDWSDWMDGKDVPDPREHGGRGTPKNFRAIKAARHRLRNAMGALLDADAEVQAKAIEILNRAADELDALDE
jgi:DNA-binding PadR family transcriptional regulator